MLADPLNGLVTDLPFVKVSGRLESGVARENDAWGSRGSTSMTREDHRDRGSESEGC